MDEATTATMFPEFNVAILKPGVALSSSESAPTLAVDAEEEEDKVASFAQMLRSGKNKPQPAVKAWPDLQQPSAGGKKPGVEVEKASPWGRKAPVGGSGGAKDAAAGKAGAATEDDGEESFVPAFKESFSDALAKAFDNLGVVEEAAAVIKASEGEVKASAEETTVDGSARKKKKKPKLLFSTSMQS